MIIGFEREGGYAPLHLKYRANTDNLPKEVGDMLRDLIKGSGILDLNPGDIAPTKGPIDVFTYSITITDGGKSKSLIFNDITAPDSLRPLLTFLQEQALGQRASE